MINLVYGGVYGLTLVIAFFIGYRNGKKEGRESCAKTAGELIVRNCCDECIKRIQRAAWNARN